MMKDRSPINGNRILYFKRADLMIRYCALFYTIYMYESVFHREVNYNCLTPTAWFILQHTFRPDPSSPGSEEVIVFTQHSLNSLNWDLNCCVVLKHSRALHNKVFTNEAILCGNVDFFFNEIILK